MLALPPADSEIFDTAGGTSQSGLEAQFDVTVRPVEPSDIARLDELDLKDFSVNFDDVVIPQGQPLDEHQLKSAVEQFLSSFTD